jgi:hypothetical protein
VARRANITSLLRDFREHKDIRALFRAIAMIVRQRRTLETLYGVWCNLMYRPSRLTPCSDLEQLASILDRRNEFARPSRLTRDRLIELYGKEFAIASLPEDFLFARLEAVCRDGDRLIVGEYGEGARIACVTARSCRLNGYYCNVAGVRHIHSIVRYEETGEFLVATGDGAKVLDLWGTTGGEVRFSRRLRRNLAGYTAAVNVNGDYYFGTDFGGRPNFITTMDGAKYFFPPKAYRRFVSAFFVVSDRYIVSVNRDLDSAGGVKTLSVFDTVEKQFVFCDYLDDRPASHPTASPPAEPSPGTSTPGPGT